ncbi:MAG: Re/Si-specific NAD(P)(+) transhydrogenase subunit alpha [Chitinophagaceae bacterium]
MIIGVLKESSGENRISLLPETVKQLMEFHSEVWVEKNAGKASYATDDAYLQAGAKIKEASEILTQAEILLKIQMPAKTEIEMIPQGRILIGFYQPLFFPEKIIWAARQKITLFSMDHIPRTSRAQGMDVLSSQANIAGYKAVLLAACNYPRYFPMLMTAAGSIAPAKLLILGAGVAGLQAIATARRLGAVVEVFDTRPAVKEEVMSLGAKFIEVEGARDATGTGGYAIEQDLDFQIRQRGKIMESIVRSDIVITTAQIPGKKAPILVTRDMMAGMRPGSIIIDLAASTGGNTEVTVDHESVRFQEVTIIGDSNLPGSMPYDASKLYGKNVFNFLKLLLTADGKLNLNFEDNIVLETCILHEGNWMNDRVKSLVAPS